LSSCRGDSASYLKFYSGSRLIREYSYDEFASLCEKLATYLFQNYGIHRNEKVLIKLGNSDTALLSYAALMLLGAVIVPVSPSSSYEDIAFIYEDTNATLMITSQEENFVCREFVFHEAFVEDLKHLQLAEMIYVQSCKSDVALLVYTSGTTSNPKGVMLTYQNLFANAQAVTHHHQMDQHHIHMCVLPLFHVNAWNFSFFATLYSKSKLILNRNFYLPNFWSIVEKEKVNVVSAVPKIIRLLLQDTRTIETNKLTHLAYFTSAAAPLSTVDAKHFYERFAIPVLQGYGMSEAVNFSLTMPIGLDRCEYEKLLTEEPLSVGIALGCNEVKIVDKNGKEVSEGVVGEVAVCGDNVMQGYYHNFAATQESLKQGVLHTGDRGFFRYKGSQKYFYLVGRFKELIIKNGENISPADLDGKIMQIRGLQESATLGFENDYTGEEIALCVVKNAETPSLEEIQEILTSTFVDAKRPKVILFVEEIPRTETGKIQRSKLQSLFVQYKHINFES
jgi:long-chain acyl-CoA synthetase